jgi:glycosyltransferase involved in cell wall biosynthesis
MKKQNIIVIASYPPQGEKHHNSIAGGASYTKNTIQSLQKMLDKHHKEHMYSITVLAEQLEGRFAQYKEDSVQVIRVWKRNSLFAFPRLLQEILFHQRHANTILLEFELAMFGDQASLLLLPFFLFVLRLFGKKIFCICHQVIADFNTVSGHINLQKNGWKISVLNIVQKLFYQLLFASVNKIIVFDDALKCRLQTVVKHPHIHVIPHAVESFSTKITKEQARKQLNIPQEKFVLLYFGFLAWYKGTDWLIQQFEIIPEEIKKGLLFIIAGGPNPNRKNKIFYQQYIAEIEESCKKNNIRLTGFVEEKHIPLYFQAADLIIFPYRTFMSASGPLSFALSFEKPIFVSDALQDIFTSKDMQDALAEKHLTIKDFIFSLHNTNLEEKIRKSMHNKKYQQALIDFAKAIKQKRNWDTIGEMYYHEIFEEFERK